MVGTTPQQPFSTIIAVKILELIRTRDLEILQLRNDRQSGKITTEELTAAIETSLAKIADDVLGVCVTTIRSLEATVDSVLQIQRQMNELRATASDL